MRKRIFSLGILLLIFCSGCYMKTEHKVTAHITIDIRQIKEVASSIEDMVSGESEKPQSRSFFSIKEVYAQTAQIKYLTPEIKAVIEKRKSRHPQIEKLLNEGIIGENNLGLLEVKEKSKILETGELLVVEENGDRMFIYRSILEQNDLPEEILEDIQRVFAKERQERVEIGVWVQFSDGKWLRKK